MKVYAVIDMDDGGEVTDVHIHKEEIDAILQPRSHNGQIVEAEVNVGRLMARGPVTEKKREALRRNAQKRWAKHRKENEDG